MVQVCRTDSGDPLKSAAVIPQSYSSVVNDKSGQKA